MAISNSQACRICKMESNVKIRIERERQSEEKTEYEVCYQCLRIIEEVVKQASNPSWVVILERTNNNNGTIN